MLVEFNSFSINDKVITLYCNEVETIFDRDRHFPKEVKYKFDTSIKYQTRELMRCIIRKPFSSLKEPIPHGVTCLQQFLELLLTLIGTDTESTPK